jgi:hypothetical protein
MSRRRNKSGDHVAAAAAPVCVNRAKTEPDVLGDLSNWLRARWLKHYVMFSALASETDREQMVQIGAFIDALKEVRSWQS